VAGRDHVHGIDEEWKHLDQEECLAFLDDMAKLEKDNNEHIQSLKNKVEGEKRENMKQKEK